MINIYDESSFLPILQDMNYPYIKYLWEHKKFYYNNSNLFDKYLAHLNLVAYKKFTWQDNEILNQF